MYCVDQEQGLADVHHHHYYYCSWALTVMLVKACHKALPPIDDLSRLLALLLRALHGVAQHTRTNDVRAIIDEKAPVQMYCLLLRHSCRLRLCGNTGRANLALLA